MPRKKFCFVPSCKNNNEKTPSKIFVSVPKNEERRRRWFKAVKIDVFYKSTHLLCCEDHFNLEEDAQNWTYYKMMGSNLILKNHVVPHKLLEVPAKVTVVPSLISSEKKRKLENNSSVASYSSNFVLKEDLENYFYVKMMPRARKILKKGVVPRFFKTTDTLTSSRKTSFLNLRDLELQGDQTENLNSKTVSYAENSDNQYKSFDDSVDNLQMVVSDSLRTYCAKKKQNHSRQEITESIDIKEEPILTYESNTSQTYSSENDSSEFDTTVKIETLDNPVKLEPLDDIKFEESLDDPEFNNACIEFGNYVATELEKLTDFNSFLIAKQCIKSVILAAQKGLYKNGLPCTNNILPVPTDCVIKMEPVDT